jgi:hypothetical protein
MGADDYILKANLSRLPSAIATTLKQREEEKKRMTPKNRCASKMES